MFVERAKQSERLANPSPLVLFLTFDSDRCFEQIFRIYSATFNFQFIKMNHVTVLICTARICKERKIIFQRRKKTTAKKFFLNFDTFDVFKLNENFTGSVRS